MTRVRPAAPADADAWLRMRLDLWPEGSEAEHREEIGRFLAGTSPEPAAVLEKVLDPATSIACVAGLSAVGDTITQEQLDEERVQNLEDAAVGYLEANPDFDFYDPDDFDAAVEAVRNSTNDGEHPAT